MSSGCVGCKSYSYIFSEELQGQDCLSIDQSQSDASRTKGTNKARRVPISVVQYKSIEAYLLPSEDKVIGMRIYSTVPLTTPIIQTIDIDILSRLLILRAGALISSDSQSRDIPIMPQPSDNTADPVLGWASSSTDQTSTLAPTPAQAQQQQQQSGQTYASVTSTDGPISAYGTEDVDPRDHLEALRLYEGEVDGHNWAAGRIGGVDAGSGGSSTRGVPTGSEGPSTRSNTAQTAGMSIFIIFGLGFG